MALAQLNVIPLGVGISVGLFVAKIQQELEKDGVTFQLNDMSTIIEGEIQHILKIVARLHNIPFDNGAQRVITTLTIDDRRDKNVQIGDKIGSLEKRKMEGNRL